MSTLAQGWTITSIGNVTCAIEQREPSGDNEFLYIDISAIDRYTKTISAPQRLSPKNAPSRARKVVRVGDVLVSMTRPNLNAVAMVDASLDGEIASTGFDVLRGIELDPRWLYYSVRSYAFVDAMSSLVQGALYPAIKSTDVRKFEIPLAPLAEQKRIADKLDSMLERVDACRKRLDCIPLVLKRLRQSILSAATSGALTADWREIEVQTIGQAGVEVSKKEKLRNGKLRVKTQGTGLQNNSPYEIPQSWTWLSNHRLAEDATTSICAGPFGTIFKAKDFRESGVPIIFLRHVGVGKYLTHKPSFMDREIWEKNHRPYSLVGGELLVTKLGDPPGTACIYPKTAGVAMVTPDVMKMSVDSDVAHPMYLMHFFNSPASKEIVRELAFGVTRLRIDLSMFKSFPIPLPPITEQVEIVRRVRTLFDFVDRLEARLANARAAADRLTPALLAKAFRGELVPQDSDDEPAADLLKRLAAIRAARKPGMERTEKD